MLLSDSVRAAAERRKRCVTPRPPASSPVNVPIVFQSPSAGNEPSAGQISSWSQLLGRFMVRLLPKAECLDQTWFSSLAEARRVVEAWRRDYNQHRPHTSLRMRTPAAFAAARPFVKRQRPATAASDAAPPPDAV